MKRLDAKEKLKMPDPWIDVAELTSLQQAGAMEVVVGEQIIAVFWHDESLFALDGMCAHQGGPIAKGNVHAGCVTCPWHGWQYELASGIQTINRQPLQRIFPVRERDGRVEVMVDGVA